MNGCPALDVIWFLVKFTSPENLIQAESAEPWVVKRILVFSLVDSEMAH